MPFIMWNCSDDDQNGNPNDYQSLIIGKWIDKDDPNYGVKFNSNGTHFWFGPDFRNGGMYKIVGDDLIAEVYDEEDEEYYSFVVTIIKLNQSTLIIDDDGEIYTYIRSN